MDSTRPPSTQSGLLRLLWMFLGPAVLAMLAFGLTYRQDAWLSVPSVAFLAILLAVIAARRVDPLDSMGEPTTPEAIRTYSIAALVIGVVVWLLANLIASE